METFLTFVDNISHVYTQYDELGYNTGSVLAPFAGKGPYECSVLLKQMCQNSSEFSDDSFAIIDEKSLEEGTLLLVEEPADADGGEASSVRVVFEMAETQLMLWSAGKTTVDEAREKAQNTADGVLRPGMELQSAGKQIIAIFLIPARVMFRLTEPWFSIDHLYSLFQDFEVALAYPI